VPDVLEGIRRELDRVLRERERIRSELSHKAIPRASLSPDDLKGREARALLCDIAAVLSAMGKDCFFIEYQTNALDLSKLIALCEDDAYRAGPLILQEALYMANRIRAQLI
jgi:hypothetical protein